MRLVAAAERYHQPGNLALPGSGTPSSVLCMLGLIVPCTDRPNCRFM